MGRMSSPVLWRRRMFAVGAAAIAIVVALLAWRRGPAASMPMAGTTTSSAASALPVHGPTLAREERARWARDGGGRTIVLAGRVLRDGRPHARGEVVVGDELTSDGTMPKLHVV